MGFIAKAIAPLISPIAMLFGAGKVNTPDPPPAPPPLPTPPPLPPEPAPEPEVKASADEEARRKLAAAAGTSATFRTSRRGAFVPASATGQKQLLGE